MDDLLDLDFASSSHKPLQASKPSPQANYGSGRTAFDYLAAPSRLGTIPPIRTTTPQNAPKPATRPATAAGGDVFAELFGTSSASSSAGAAPPSNGLSMAERLQRESAAKLAGYGSAANGSGASSPLDSLEYPPALSPQSRTASPALSPGLRVPTPSSIGAGKTPTSRSASPAIQPPRATPPPAAAASADAWNLDLLAAAVPSRHSPLAAAAADSPVDDLFDMGFDGTRFAPSPAAAKSKSPPPVTSSTDDFDLLDAFAAPAAPVSAVDRPHENGSSERSSAPRAPTSTQGPTPRRQTPLARSDSPPPHIVGQLVEMGFAPAAATAALGATRGSGETGEWSVDAALEALVGQQEADEAKRQKQREADEWGDEDDIRIGRRRSWEHDDDGGGDFNGHAHRTTNPPPVRRKASDGAGEKAPPRTTPARNNSGASARKLNGHDAEAAARDQAKVLQEQANEVLAQAQKIGLSMFKSANAYWGEGKKALQKALDEQRAAARAGGGGGGAGAPGGGGKPKWWRDGMDGMDAEEEAVAQARAVKGKGRAEEPSSGSGFKDSDDEEGPEPATRSRAAEYARQAPNSRAPAAAEPQPANEYRSPFRRAKPASAPQPAPAEADLLSGMSAPTPAASSRAPQQQPAPPTRSSTVSSGSASPRPWAMPNRQHVAVSASALATASKHKSAGNEHFKLGRFGDATASFTLALNALPEDWIGCVPLLNNRAQARLRSGEEKSAAADCSAAVTILLAPTKGEVDLAALAAESSSLPPEVGQLFSSGGGAAAIDLKDQLGKSLARRAKANEANEKWSLASEDWQKLLTLGDEVVTRGAGGIKMISDGVARCKQMLDGPGPARPAGANSGPRSSATANGANGPTARKAPPRKPATPVQVSGEAVRALQAQQAASAAEDDLRLQLKDQVDAQIAAWKGGKETNLRALIASLDAVLWPSLGWKTVGMHELISENQLKVRYVRAIAKVHPDKLNAQNTTLEQRMIAALVFAALNDAWNGMK
ncbi:hypothetical protein JCM10908_003047 [Rhodotorula pacifica]|uniref:auxilin-like protein SWA2 n=1 Tax=Rhodotorula pacifica TaxID=1495444 RepID=UPI0031823B97